MRKQDVTKVISDSEIESLTKVLQALSLLPSSESQEAGTKSAIEDFSLRITTTTQRLIKAITGGGAFAGLAASTFAWMNDQGSLVLATCIASTAVVLAVGLYASAKVMDGDVRGRASAGTAGVEARGAVARTLLNLYGRSDRDPKAEQPTKDESGSERPSELQILLAMTAFRRNFKVSSNHGASTVGGARWTTDDHLEVKLANGDWVRAERIDSFSGELA